MTEASVAQPPLVLPSDDALRTGERLLGQESYADARAKVAEQRKRRGEPA